MRPDGRDAQQLRAMACETKTLSMLDGSARYSHQGSCVLASVTGPIEAGANKQGERAHVQVGSCICLFVHVYLLYVQVCSVARQLRGSHDSRALRSPSPVAPSTTALANARCSGT